MLPFEEQILGYIHDTGNHVLYRVTPMYNEEELVCRGVRLEAQSVEDHGKTLCFHVYCYNLQPHVQIDYATGRNQASGTSPNHDKNRFASPRDQKGPLGLPRAALASACMLQTKPHATWRGPPHSARPAWPERHKAPAHSLRASW